MGGQAGHEIDVVGVAVRQLGWGFWRRQWGGPREYWRWLGARRGVGGQQGFDAGGVEAGVVEEGQGFQGRRAAEQVADAGVDIVDRCQFVRRQGLALVDEQMVRLGEGAEAVARGGEIGGAQGLGAIGRVGRDFAERCRNMH